VALALPHGGGDQVTHAGGGPDPRERPLKGLRSHDIYIPDLHLDTIKVQARNFQ
jgi:error-prone DNA polymerase